MHVFFNHELGICRYIYLTSFKIRNHYIVANLTVVVYLAEDCCASSMKLEVPEKVVLFFVAYIYIKR